MASQFQWEASFSISKNKGCWWIQSKKLVDGYQGALNFQHCIESQSPSKNNPYNSVRRFFSWQTAQMGLQSLYDKTVEFLTWSCNQFPAASSKLWLPVTNQLFLECRSEESCQPLKDSSRVWMIWGPEKAFLLLQLFLFPTVTTFTNTLVTLPIVSDASINATAWAKDINYLADGSFKKFQIRF